MLTAHTHDPALQARTFISNSKLTAALSRLATRNAQTQTPAPIISGVESDGSDAGDNRGDVIPLAVVPVGEHPKTVRCPLCNKWAMPEGNRFYHIIVLGLETHVRDDARSQYCELKTDERPTDDELNEQYLLINGWERAGRDQQDGLSDFWRNPITGDTVPFAVAMNVQNGRDFSDFLAESAEVSQ